MAFKIKITNIIIIPGKEGPIYSVAWSPKSHEFCVVYGFMPAIATLFNLKCEPVFKIGGGPRNSIYYNPHGNLLLLGGFGNLRGLVEIWDTNTKNKIGKFIIKVYLLCVKCVFDVLGTCEAPDSTLLEWAPDGVHFLTATTAPRLRIGNGYKIWHYSGSLLFEKPWTQDELYEVCWKVSYILDIKAHLHYAIWTSHLAKPKVMDGFVGLCQFANRARWHAKVKYNHMAKCSDDVL